MQKIVAGIVLFNPDETRLEMNIRSIIPQVDLILLVDNASVNIKEIEKTYQSILKIRFIKNKQNLGVATALCQIVKYFEEYDWVLTLDQDSVCPPNLIQTYQKYINIKNVAIIAPAIVDRNVGKIVEKKQHNIEYVNWCITSASLTNISICKQIGYFDERLFIDLVDYDYCIRLSQYGYKILKTNEVTLLHQLGNLELHRIFGRTVYVGNHSSIRKYYNIRNRVYLMHKYKGILNPIYEYEKIIKAFIKVLIYENDKILKLKAMSRGLFKGMKMKKF
ncbi:glycosyltransferase family 2 protein [Sporolactobacillus laevolacticus]|uniref:glycosyltransferase family 2 protein n=1 Tax=Sporolactobacillus laevolacticus TaxID=33018 RepID=UPI0025B3A10C|nr:glycosyltransferase family 2 protein [Sporolactobacillus laevolacticus]MDN3954747.1 glycosyltransferase family 2 protein [Sporolactobacillus laevolacticus]